MTCAHIYDHFSHENMVIQSIYLSRNIIFAVMSASLELNARL